jgi:protein-tyrosine kinase
MSRYFETLKEVSRSQVLPMEAPKNGKTPEIETSPGNGPLMNMPELTQLPEAPGIDLPFEHSIPPAAPRRQEWTARVMPIKVDPRVPLTPHTEDNSVVEQYRKLRTKIQQEHATRPVQSLLVASPGPGEGKTVTVMNLALSFSMLPDFKVLVIDGDLRKSSIAKWLGIIDVPGLSNVIDGSAKPLDVVFRGEGLPLYFMTAGTSGRPSAELLTSPVLPETIRGLKEQFDLILLDSPPVNLLADTQMLAGSCDAVLLVARAFTTTSKAFQKTLAELDSFRLVGTVLNGGMRGREYKNYYTY